LYARQYSWFPPFIWPVNGGIEVAMSFFNELDRSNVFRVPSWLLAMQDNYDLWQARHSAYLSQVRKIPFEVNA